MNNKDYDEIIERLKAQAAAAAGGRMIVHESEGMDPSVREQFWQHVVDFETAETTDLVKKLNTMTYPIMQIRPTTAIAFYHRTRNGRVRNTLLPISQEGHPYNLNN